MSYAALKKHAAGLPGATQDIKWGADWVASVGGKMFLCGGPEPGAWRACSFKVDEHRFLELDVLRGLHVRANHERNHPRLARARPNFHDVRAGRQRHGERRDRPARSRLTSTASWS